MEKERLMLKSPLKKTKKGDFIYNDLIACRQPSVTVDRKLEKKIEDTYIYQKRACMWFLWKVAKERLREVKSRKLINLSICSFSHLLFHYSCCSFEYITSMFVAPIACLHFDVNIRNIGHVLCRKRTSRRVCTGILCWPKLLSHGHSKLETVGKFYRIPYALWFRLLQV